MAQQAHLYSPNVDCYGDNSTYLGVLKVVKGKSSRENNIDGLAKCVFHARLPRSMRQLTINQLYNALNEHFGERCSCSHDCCGCYFGGVVDVYKRGRLLAFTTRYTRNV